MTREISPKQQCYLRLFLEVSAFRGIEKITEKPSEITNDNQMYIHDLACFADLLHNAVYPFMHRDYTNDDEQFLLNSGLFYLNSVNAKSSHAEYIAQILGSIIHFAPPDSFERIQHIYESIQKYIAVCSEANQF